MLRAINYFQVLPEFIIPYYGQRNHNYVSHFIGSTFSCTCFMCRFKVDFTEELKSQISHFNKFLLSWTDWTCFFKSLLLLPIWSQISHIPFSLWECSKCLFKSSLSKQIKSHILHSIGLILILPYLRYPINIKNIAFSGPLGQGDPQASSSKVFPSIFGREITLFNKSWVWV